MRILVLHSLPNRHVRYGEHIDHDIHEVCYLTTSAGVDTLPRGVRRTVIVRSHELDHEASILAAVGELGHVPERVIAFAEFDIVPAAKIRARFGLPGPGVAQAIAFRDKIAMKELVRSAGLRAPRFIRVEDVLQADGPQASWSGKTVLKPVAGAASANTHVFPSPGDALEAVRLGHVGAAPEDLEIEEFVAGPIMHIDGVLIEGEPAAIQASRYVGDCLSYAVDGTPLGGVHIENSPALVDWTSVCLKAVGIVDGMFHLEAIAAVHGPVFLEVGARCGAIGVVESFEFATRVHMPGAAIRLMIDGPDNVPVPCVPGHHERYGWFSFPGHLIGTDSCRVAGAVAVRDHPLVRRWKQLGPGDPVNRDLAYSYHEVPVGGLIGPGTTEELEAFLQEIYASVTVAPFSPVNV